MSVPMMLVPSPNVRKVGRGTGVAVGDGAAVGFGKMVTIGVAVAGTGVTAAMVWVGVAATGAVAVGAGLVALATRSGLEEAPAVALVVEPARLTATR
jgi:hypothetical protein